MLVMSIYLWVKHILQLVCRPSSCALVHFPFCHIFTMKPIKNKTIVSQILACAAFPPSFFLDSLQWHYATVHLEVLQESCIQTLYDHWWLALFTLIESHIWHTSLPNLYVFRSSLMITLTHLVALGFLCTYTHQLNILPWFWTSSIDSVLYNLHIILVFLMS